MATLRLAASGAVTFAVVATALVATPAGATPNCSFSVSTAAWTLDADCTTDSTIEIPDGVVLDGNGHTITAVDPPAGHFTGAVVANNGASAHVRNLRVDAAGLSNVCDAGADRLRGIMFAGASGSITDVIVTGINQGQSGCQEGNAIEVRNAPFDGTHPATVTVEVAHNTVTGYQKTGIVANGDVDVSVHHNRLGASATQDSLAANTIQLGFGAQGSVSHNRIEGNQWKGTSDFAASAILIYDADAVYVGLNNVTGNSDVGLFVVSDGGTYEKNVIRDDGADHPNSGYDIGIGGYGINLFNKNKVRGFDQPFDPEPLSGDKNKALPSAWRPQVGAESGDPQRPTSLRDTSISDVAAPIVGWPAASDLSSGDSRWSARSQLHALGSIGSWFPSRSGPRLA